MVKDFSFPLVLMVAVAGAAGSLLRWGMAVVVQRAAGGGFPWGTYCVNILGCLAFGLVVALAEDKAWIGPQARLVALTGFMGAFTTFSTFAYDSALFYREGMWVMLAANVIGQNVLGVACVLMGLKLGQSL
jgi:CrcB protein